eukprot:maker-scaffold77_size404793-snap-gene-2.15 protein:Tk04781 transcript:maker-scaffold77_size404793-snap-gene-2.15-mRNA-1 annotation:"sam-dependent methlyltransferase"
MTPSLAFRVKSELVLTFHPFMTGMAHAATGLADFSTSTRHMRQLPAIDNRSWCLLILLPYAANTLVDNGIAMWNKFPALREASTKRMASNVAKVTMDNFLLCDHYRNIGLALAVAEEAERHAHLFQINNYHDILMENIIDSLDATKGHKLVELGAGSCRFAHKVAEKLHLKQPILCVDSFHGILDMEKKFKHIETLEMEALDFVKKDLDYDRLFILGSLHHLGLDEDLPDIFAGIFRHLRAGGKLVIEKPDIEYVDLPLFDKAIKELNKNEHVPTKELINLLTQAGFKHFRIKKFKFTFSTPKAWLIQKIRERAFSCLGAFTHQEIEEGVKELEEKWKDLSEIKFTPEKDIITADKP